MKIKHIIISVLVLLIFIGIYSAQQQKIVSNQLYKDISLVAFKEKVKQADEKTEIIETDRGDVKLIKGNDHFRTHVNPNQSPITDYLQSSKATYKYQQEASGFGTSFSFFFFVVVMMMILLFINRRTQQQQQQAQAPKKEEKIVFEKPVENMDSVGGLNDETRRELTQIVDLFKNHEKAKALGIKKPKSALLHGPPGTGKTLIAKAIANELNAVFFAKSGSSFMEMYVGVGSSRIRELFHLARTVATEEKPSLIFIDEVDAIAKKRGGKNSHEERENTLNELLKELDGVQTNENVFFIAATNLYDSLDDAFKRSGRISNELYIGLPEEKGRMEILDIHSKQYAVSPEVTESFPAIAKTIRGYSGADIAEVYSKAAKHAFHKQKEVIEVEDMNYAIDRMILGTQNHKLTDKEIQKRVAYHEAGHALIQAIRFPQSIRKATIIPRGNALGFVAPIPKEIDLATYEEIMDKLAMIVAGGVAERQIFGSHSIGVSGDVEQAKQWINTMVTYGIQKEAFRLTFDSKQSEKEKEDIFNEAVSLCQSYITANIDSLHAIAQALLERETLDGEDIQKLAEAN